MRIASPFEEPSGPASDASAKPPASFGQASRRPGERDRTRTRARSDAQQQAPAGPARPQRGDHDSAPAKTPTGGPDAAAAPSAPRPSGQGEGGQVVPFPGAPAEPPAEAVPVPADASAEVAAVDAGGAAEGGPLVPAPLAEAARTWWAEASATTGRALDGSIWRARPPALRDSAVRLQRAEWSGGLPVLRWAGWIYGYPALAVRALLMGVIWLLDHPTRLIVLATVIAAALYL